MFNYYWICTELPHYLWSIAFFLFTAFINCRLSKWCMSYKTKNYKERVVCLVHCIYTLIYDIAMHCFCVDLHGISCSYETLCKYYFQSDQSSWPGLLTLLGATFLCVCVFKAKSSHSWSSFHSIRMSLVKHGGPDQEEGLTLIPKKLFW